MSASPTEPGTWPQQLRRAASQHSNGGGPRLVSKSSLILRRTYTGNLDTASGDGGHEAPGPRPAPRAASRW